MLLKLRHIFELFIQETKNFKAILLRKQFRVRQNYKKNMNVIGKRSISC